MFVWFVGNQHNIKDGKPLVHAHWYSVKYKETRYAEIDVELIKCDNFGSHTCSEHDEVQRFGWTKLQFYMDKTRWLRSPAALVLFGNRVYDDTSKR